LLISFRHRELIHIRLFCAFACLCIDLSAIANCSRLLPLQEHTQASIFYENDSKGGNINFEKEIWAPLLPKSRERERERESLVLQQHLHSTKRQENKGIEKPR
jgi:hypothetical protein